MMKLLGVLLFAVATVTVTAKHRKEWQRVDPVKLARERPQTFYKSDVPACTKGAGFYRDPQDCHQFIRCVDEFGSGRHFSVYVGRCEPGLVFDENISACNWPELAAPCSNSPEKMQETRKPLRPEQVPQDNIVYEGKNRDKPFVQQQEIHVPQDSSAYETQQKEVLPVVQEIQIATQETIYQDEIPQVIDDTQSFEKPQEVHQEQVQEEIHQEKVQEPDIQPVIQQENHEVQSFQESVQEEMQSASDFTEDKKTEQQQIIYQEPSYENNHENRDSVQQQVPEGNFQQVGYEENQQFEIPSHSDQSQISQQESQSQWWVVEDNPQHNPPNHADQVTQSDVVEEPIFCSKEGFFRHPENCSQFVRCVEIERGAYAVHFFECPKQLVFDEKDSACVVEDIHSCRTNARKKREVSNTGLRCNKEGFFRHPKDCRSFYRCVQTASGSYETHLFSCPANLVFDEEYTTCNWPEKAPPCDSPSQQLRSTRKPAQTERPAYKPTTRTTTMSTRRPGNDYIDKSITEETYGRRRSTKKPSSTTQSYYETEPKCRRAGFFKNDKDCTKYYKCVQRGNNFVRYELSCPNNFAYDDMSNKCIPQRYASSCFSRNKPPYPPRQDDETTMSPETTSASSSSSKQSDSDSDDIVCEKEGYFRHPEDCNQFYRCVDFNGDGQEFVRYDFKCPEGLVFDEENSVCNWPDQSAPCDTRKSGGDKGEGGESEETGGNVTEGESGPGKEEESSSSESPEVASSTSSEQSSTESSQTTQSSSSSDSSESDTGKESDGSGSENECTKEGFYRNPDDCNKFYRCVDFNEEGKEFVRYDFNCPEGLVFDEANSVCNWPSDSEPCDTSSGSGNEGGKGQDGTESSTSSATDKDGGSSDEDQGSSQSTPGDSSDANSSSDSGTDGSESSTVSSNESTSGSGGRGGGKNSGECTEEGFFRNPDDCNKFYRCVDQNEDGQNFVKYDFTCPEGLVFDEENSVCNWPDQSAPCDGGSPGEEQGTTARSEQEGSESSQTTSGGGQSSSEQTTASDSTTESTTSSTRESTSQSTDGNDGEGGSTSETSKGDSGDGSGGNQGECTEEGFFRNPDDCTKFYRCVDQNGDGKSFVRYDFECPEGLVFDEVNSVCNWPDQSAPCETRDGSDGSDSDKDSSSTQTESSSEKPGESSTSDSSGNSEQPTQSSTEQSTTKSSTSGDSSECTEPGFYRCKDDCSKFYRCVDENGQLVRYDFQCPDGLIFDDKNKKCDWPSSELTCEMDSSSSTTTTASQESSTTSSYESTTAATTTQSSGSTSGDSSTKKECTEEGFFRNPDDCSKYYRCIDEGDGTFTREDFACAEDEVFDEEMRYCNRKDLAPPCDDDAQTTSSQSQSTTTEASTQSSTKSGEKSECTEPGFFRCQDDCTKFYRCVEDEESGNLVRHDFQCPDGLIFDDRNDKCDWPSSDLTCDTDSSSSTTQSSATDSQTSGTSAGTTSTAGSTSSSSEKPASSEGCTEEGFFRNPDDCSKYYRCIDEGDGTLKREDFACEEDEVFDEEMRYCNRKDLAPPCDGDSSTTESSTRGTTSQSSTDQPESTSSSSGSSSSGSGECTEEGFHRDPNDCSKFYRCVDFKGDGQSFTRYDFDCPEGLVFDENNEVCNWPSSVPECESSGGSGGSTGGSSTTTSKDSDSSTTSSGESSTSGSTSSSSSESEQTSSPATETTSTTESSRTTDSEQSSSSTTDNRESSTDSNDGATSGGSTSSGSTSSGGGSSSGDTECTEEGFFRHPDDCSKFYRCVDFAGTGESFVRYDFDCPEGLVFDEVNSVCNWPEQSPKCESGSSGGSDSNESKTTDSTESSTENNGGSQSTSSETSTTSQGGDSTTSRDQTTTRSSSSTGTTSSSDEFRCEEEGYYKHPSDCKKYYECKRDEDGELVRIDCECPDGQIWDNEGWYCNSEELSPPCDSGSSFKCKEEGFFRDPEDCTRYYQCNRTGSGENDFTSERFQCDDGLVFDESGRYCNAPELSEPCDESSSTSSGTTGGDSSSTSSSGTSDNQGKCTKEGFFRNPDDCTKYYQCSKNEDTDEFDRTDYECPDGRIFDEGSSYCNDPELSEQPCDDDTMHSSESTSQQTTSAASSSKASDSGTRSGGGDPECTQEGFFRHPDDCNKFYRCVDFSGSGESFVRYDFDCPEGLHFDEVNSVCNWPTMTPPCESNNRLFYK